MSFNSNVQVTYCKFSPPVPATKRYTCYKKETCCEQGCCINGPYQVYQVWYYWLLFLLVFGLISGGSWFCRRLRAGASRQASRSAPRSSGESCSYSHPRCSRRSCGEHFSSSERREFSSSETRSLTDFEDNIVLDRLFVSFRNNKQNLLTIGNTFGDPPSYSSIFTSDSNMPPPKFCPLYSYYGPPPTYSSMFKSTPPRTKQTMNQNASNHDASAIPAGVAQIQVHAEGGPGNKSTYKNNRENDRKSDVGGGCGRTATGGINSTNEGGTNIVTTVVNNVLNVNESAGLTQEGMATQCQRNTAPRNV